MKYKAPKLIITEDLSTSTSAKEVADAWKEAKELGLERSFWSQHDMSTPFEFLKAFEGQDVEEMEKHKRWVRAKREHDKKVKVEKTIFRNRMMMFPVMFVLCVSVVRIGSPWSSIIKLIGFSMLLLGVGYCSISIGFWLKEKEEAWARKKLKDYNERDRHQYNNE